MLSTCVHSHVSNLAGPAVKAERLREYRIIYQLTFKQCHTRGQEYLRVRNRPVILHVGSLWVLTTRRSSSGKQSCDLAVIDLQHELGEGIDIWQENGGSMPEGRQ